MFVESRVSIFWHAVLVGLSEFLLFKAGTELNSVFRFVLFSVLFSVVLGVVLVVLAVAF